MRIVWSSTAQHEVNLGGVRVHHLVMYYTTWGVEIPYKRFPRRGRACPSFCSGTAQHEVLKSPNKDFKLGVACAHHLVTYSIVQGLEIS